jgi:hypothetical protein
MVRAGEGGRGLGKKAVYPVSVRRKVPERDTALFMEI